MERIKNWIKTEIEAEADVYPYKCKECPAKFKEIEKAKDHFETKHVSFTEFVPVLKACDEGNGVEIVKLTVIFMTRML